MPAPTSSLTNTATSNSVFMPPIKTTNKDSFKPQSDSLLFSKLPGELRNRIWRLAVLDDTAIPLHVAHYKNRDGEYCSCVQIQHALMQVCKQAHHEVTDIYYLENTFRITQDFFYGRAMEVLVLAMKPWAAEMTRLEVTHDLMRDSLRPARRTMSVAMDLTVLSDEGRITVVPPLVDVEQGRGMQEDLADLVTLFSLGPSTSPAPPQKLCCCKIFALADKCAGRTLLEWVQQYVKLVRDSKPKVGECGFIPHCWGCAGLELLGQSAARYQPSRRQAM